MELNPTHSYTLRGEGLGGIAGFAKGNVNVALSEVPAGTQPTYAAVAQVGGKIAQLGSRLMVSTAQKLAAQFFDHLKTEIESPAAAPADQPELRAAVTEGVTRPGTGRRAKATRGVIRASMPIIRRRYP